MKDAFRKVQRLCELETGAKPASRDHEVFQQWLAGKRRFTVDELSNAYILKVGELCGGYLVRLLADGTLEECNLFKPAKTWGGTWRVDEHGALHVICEAFNDEKEPILCRLEIVANPHGIMHSACEDNDDPKSDLLEHFQVLYLGRELSLVGLASATAAVVA